MLLHQTRDIFNHLVCSFYKRVILGENMMNMDTSIINLYLKALQVLIQFD